MPRSKVGRLDGQPHLTISQLASHLYASPRQFKPDSDILERRPNDDEHFASDIVDREQCGMPHDPRRGANGDEVNARIDQILCPFCASYVIYRRESLERVSWPESEVSLDKLPFEVGFQDLKPQSLPIFRGKNARKVA
jgi:hypothetical protein